MMESLRRAWGRLRGFFSPPKREVQSWVVDDSPPPRVEAAESSLWVYVEGFKAFWLNQRRRVLRLLAAIVALTDIILGAVLYSNIWYLNLMLYAYLVPSFIITIHYVRLTRNVK